MYGNFTNQSISYSQEQSGLIDPNRGVPIPNGLTQDPELVQALPIIAATLVGAIQDTRRANAWRMYLFNQTSRNNWQNQDYAEYLRLTLDAFDMLRTQRGQQVAQASQTLVEVVQMVTEFFAVDNARTNPELASLVNNPQMQQKAQHTAAKFQELQNQLAGFKQWKLNQQRQSGFGGNSPGGFGGGFQGGFGQQPQNHFQQSYHQNQPQGFGTPNHFPTQTGSTMGRGHNETMTFDGGNFTHQTHHTQVQTAAAPASSTIGRANSYARQRELTEKRLLQERQQSSSFNKDFSKSYEYGGTPTQAQNAPVASKATQQVQTVVQEAQSQEQVSYTIKDWVPSSSQTSIPYCPPFAAFYTFEKNDKGDVVAIINPITEDNIVQYQKHVLPGLLKGLSNKQRNDAQQKIFDQLNRPIDAGEIKEVHLGRLIDTSDVVVVESTAHAALVSSVVENRKALVDETSEGSFAISAREVLRPLNVAGNEATAKLIEAINDDSINNFEKLAELLKQDRWLESDDTTSAIRQLDAHLTLHLNSYLANELQICGGLNCDSFVSDYLDLYEYLSTNYSERIAIAFRFGFDRLFDVVVSLAQNTSQTPDEAKNVQEITGAAQNVVVIGSSVSVTTTNLTLTQLGLRTTDNPIEIPLGQDSYLQKLDDETSITSKDVVYNLLTTHDGFTVRLYRSAYNGATIYKVIDPLTLN